MAHQPIFFLLDRFVAGKEDTAYVHFADNLTYTLAVCKTVDAQTPQAVRGIFTVVNNVANRQIMRALVQTHLERHRFFVGAVDQYPLAVFAHAKVQPVVHVTHRSPYKGERNERYGKIKNLEFNKIQKRPV